MWILNHIWRIWGNFPKIIPLQMVCVPRRSHIFTYELDVAEAVCFTVDQINALVNSILLDFYIVNTHITELNITDAGLFFWQLHIKNIYTAGNRKKSPQRRRHCPKYGFITHVKTTKMLISCMCWNSNMLNYLFRQQWFIFIFLQEYNLLDTLDSVGTTGSWPIGTSITINIMIMSAARRFSSY